MNYGTTFSLTRTKYLKKSDSCQQTLKSMVFEAQFPYNVLTAAKVVKKLEAK
jgi:hypothetical protein